MSATEFRSRYPTQDAQTGYNTKIPAELLADLESRRGLDPRPDHEHMKDIATSATEPHAIELHVLETNSQTALQYTKNNGSNPDTDHPDILATLSYHQRHPEDPQEAHDLLMAKAVEQLQAGSILLEIGLSKDSPAAVGAGQAIMHRAVENHREAIHSQDAEERVLEANPTFMNPWEITPEKAQHRAEHGTSIIRKMSQEFGEGDPAKERQVAEAIASQMIQEDMADLIRHHYRNREFHDVPQLAYATRHALTEIVYDGADPSMRQAEQQLADMNPKAAAASYVSAGETITTLYETALTAANEPMFEQRISGRLAATGREDQEPTALLNHIPDNWENPENQAQKFQNVMWNAARNLVLSGNSGPENAEQNAVILMELADRAR